jgi:exopolysaccharide biosynthesis WecB/TagA/CpsF family protein
VIHRGKRSVVGVSVDVIDYECAVDCIIRAARDRRGFAVSALAVHGVMTGARDPEHRFRLNNFDLAVPDGQPVRWALNLLHNAGLKDRVYGPTLMLKICERCAEEGLPIYLYGSSTEVLSRLMHRLTAQFPTLRIAGAQPSRFRRVSAEEKAEIAQTIRESGATVVFAGLGCPRQEVWAYEYRPLLSMPIVAVGAAFDFHAGTVAQAPSILQRAGLEWAYRLSKEPRRLWRRYALLNPLYIAMVAAQATGLRDFVSRSGRPPNQELNYG